VKRSTWASLLETRAAPCAYDQTQVLREPGWLLVGKAGSDACYLEQDSGSRGEDECLEPAVRCVSCAFVTRQNELLPQPAAVLACELPRQDVEIAHPLDGDQESLVRRETGLREIGDLLAEMIL